MLVLYRRHYTLCFTAVDAVRSLVGHPQMQRTPSAYHRYHIRDSVLASLLAIVKSSELDGKKFPFKASTLLPHIICQYYPFP